MGKPTGFLEYERKESVGEAPLKRIKHFNEFHTPLSKKEQERQGARCMNCGVPFCQSGILIKGMVTGCPLNNLIPEWNDATYTGNWDEAYNRLRKTNPFPEFTGRVSAGSNHTLYFRYFPWTSSVRSVLLHACLYQMLR